MKLGRILLLAALLPLPTHLAACAIQVQGKASLFRGDAPKVDQKTVESFIRAGNEAGAREYLMRLGLSESETAARLQEAREVVAKEK
jgi:hypothetical protein